MSEVSGAFLTPLENPRERFIRGIQAGATANRVALEAMVLARNEGLDIFRCLCFCLVILVDMLRLCQGVSQAARDTDEIVFFSPFLREILRQRIESNRIERFE
jgi:hypothetical protein